jgi:hypothetical protein
MIQDVAHDCPAGVLMIGPCPSKRQEGRQHLLRLEFRQEPGHNPVERLADVQCDAGARLCQQMEQHPHLLCRTDPLGQGQKGVELRVLAERRRVHGEVFPGRRAVPPQGERRQPCSQVLNEIRDEWLLSDHGSLPVLLHR